MSPKKKSSKKLPSKKIQKPLPILLADDIALEPNHEQRSGAVKQVATALAKRLQTSIELAHVENLLLYPVPSPVYRPVIERFFKDQKSKLSSLAATMDVPTRATFLNGDPVKELLKLTSKGGRYEMLVLGTHGRTGLGRLVLGSVAEEVLRHATLPVLTVGPKAQEHTSGFLSKAPLKILVPTNLNANSLQAEQYALSLAKRLGGEVIFFHSLFDTLHPVIQTALSVPTPAAQVQSLLDEMQADAEKGLAAKAKKATAQGITATIRLDTRMTSSSEAVLSELAQSGSSLVVMGTHGRSLLAGAFFGRTARDVILGATVPVIAIRSRRS